MNIEKADIFTIVQLGNIKLLKHKLNIINEKIEDIKDEKDKNGISLLERSIIGRNFDISKEILNVNPKLNIISNDGYNELHYIAFNLLSDESIDIAKIIIQKGVDLNLKDKVYGNTPFMYICQAVIKNKNLKLIDFAKFCMDYNPNLNCKNMQGFNAKDIINMYGDYELVDLILNFNK